MITICSALHVEKSAILTFCCTRIKFRMFQKRRSLMAIGSHIFIHTNVFSPSCTGCFIKKPVDCCVNVSNTPSPCMYYVHRGVLARRIARGEAKVMLKQAMIIAHPYVYQQMRGDAGLYCPTTTTATSDYLMLEMLA